MRIRPPHSALFHRLPDAAAVLIVGCIVHGWIVFQPSAMMGFTDAVDYLLLADYFRGLVYGGMNPEAPAFFEMSRYPPLYPAILGLAGGGSQSQPTALLVTNLFAVASLLAIWGWAHQVIGRWGALAVALSLALYPAHFLWCLQTVSEPMSLAVVATSLYLLERSKRSSTALPFALMLVALAPLVRAANLPLLLACAIALAVRPGFSASRKARLVALISLPSILWYAFRQQSGAESYVTGLTLDRAVEALGGMPDALWLQPWRLLIALVENWGIAGSGLGLLVAALLILLAVWGCAFRLRQRQPDGVFAACYLAIILVWPYPAELGRLVVPIYPVMVAHAFVALRSWAMGGDSRPESHGQRHLQAAFVILLAIAQLPTVVNFSVRATAEVEADLVNDIRRREYFTTADHAEAITRVEDYARIRMLAESLRATVPDGACVYASDPRLLRSLAGVIAYSYPPGIQNIDEARRLLSACDYFFVFAFGMSQIGLPPHYPGDALAGWTTPQLVSAQERDGATRIVAALLTRKAEASHGADSLDEPRKPQPTD